MQPFHHGLVIVFSMAVAMSLIAAFASVSRGTKYVHNEAAAPAAKDQRVAAGRGPAQGKLKAHADADLVGSVCARPASEY